MGTEKVFFLLKFTPRHNVLYLNSEAVSHTPFKTYLHLSHLHLLHNLTNHWSWVQPCMYLLPHIFTDHKSVQTFSYDAIFFIGCSWPLNGVSVTKTPKPPLPGPSDALLVPLINQSHIVSLALAEWEQLDLAHWRFVSYIHFTHRSHCFSPLIMKNSCWLIITVNYF